VTIDWSFVWSPPFLVGTVIAGLLLNIVAAFAVCVVDHVRKALPASYRRMDLRVTRAFTLFGLSALAFIDVNNVFDWTTIQACRYQFDSAGNPVVRGMGLW
jgi:hypothetical protein